MLANEETLYRTPKDVGVSNYRESFGLRQFESLILFSKLKIT